MTNPKPITEGEFRVGIDFNPAGNPQVAEIKAAAADLIDMVGAYGCDERTAALAKTAFEDGAMWAVKSITKPDR